jgi:hypothetical protein
MKILFLFLLLSISGISQGLVKVNTSTYFVNNNNLVLKDMDLTVDGNLKANGVISFTNGNFTMNGGFDSGTGKFVFTNTTTHDHYLYTSSSSNNTFYDITVLGDVATLYDLHLLSDINVNNHLQLQSQKLNLSNHNINFGTTGYIDGESNSQFLYDDPDIGTGYIQSVVNIGSSSTVNPGNLGLEITTHSNQMGSTVIRRYHKKADIGSGLYGTHRIFDVNPTYNGVDYGGNLNVDLKFNYFDDILGSIDASTLKLYRSTDGITWENKGGSVDISNGYITVTGFEHFSQVTIAPDNGALPVELLYFEGWELKPDNMLKWVTVSENNSSYFDIEWSIDGDNWRSIGVRNAAGNSNEKINYYYFTPIEFCGINYYRLNQIDIDGKSKEYGPILINNTTNKKNIIKYINLLGQIVEKNTKGIILQVYEDGTSDKIVNY